MVPPEVDLMTLDPSHRYSDTGFAGRWHYNFYGRLGKDVIPREEEKVCYLWVFRPASFRQPSAAWLNRLASFVRRNEPIPPVSIDRVT